MSFQWAALTSRLNTILSKQIKGEKREKKGKKKRKRDGSRERKKEQINEKVTTNILVRSH